MFLMPYHLNVERDLGSNSPTSWVDQNRFARAQFVGDDLTRQLDPGRSGARDALKNETIAREDSDTSFAGNRC